MVCRFPPATGFSDFQRNQNCPYFQSSIKLKRPSTTPFSGQIWTISTHLSNSAAEWHRAFIGRHSARNSEQRNARRHRAFIFGVVRLIFERLHAIPKLLNVDFVTANLQLSITAKKSNVCNKPLVYILHHFSLRIGIFSIEVGDGQLIPSATSEFRQWLTTSTDCIKLRLRSFIFDWMQWISAGAFIFDKSTFNYGTLQFFSSVRHWFRNYKINFVSGKIFEFWICFNFS